MGNLVTLDSLLLIQPVNPDDNEIYLSDIPSAILAATGRLTPGLRLYVDKESMSIVSFRLSGVAAANPVRVRRGQDGTGAGKHANGATVWIAQPHQLYSTDPSGLPPTELLVSPWINVLTGDVFFARGDAVGAGATTNLRHWVKQATTWSEGALGVVTVTSDPTAST